MQPTKLAQNHRGGTGDRRCCRREMLQAGGLGVTGMALSAWLGGVMRQNVVAAAPKKGADDLASGYIDAHVHVWTADTAHYPLAAGFKKEGMKPPSFTPEELFAHARPCGVRRTVLIQMSFYRFDNSYMLDSMRRCAGVFAGVAVIDHRAANLRETMRGLAKQGVRGFRLSTQNGPVANWSDDPGMVAMWRQGAEDGLAMCLLIDPEALPAVERLCARFPDTPVVVDHFARVGIDGVIREKDLAALCRLAKHKHTTVKISAYWALGKRQRPYLDLLPMIRRVLDAFGPPRLMWATDCPWQVQNGHTYADSIALVRDRLVPLSEGDRDYLLRRTAERVFFT